MRTFPVTSQTLIGALLDESPQLIRLMFDRNLGCVGCAMIRFCTLKDIGHYYRLDVDELIDEIQNYESGRDLNE
jgi:hybrid cluster-associated redox disulfide protein